MARRNPNKHTIVQGAFKAKLPGTASRTTANKAIIYFAKPPVEGWPGGDPLKNGCRG